MKNLKETVFPIAIIIAGLIIAGAIVFVSQKKIASPEILSPQQVGEKVLKYINENVLKGQGTASLGEIVEESGLYKLTVKIGDQEFPSYVTRDGKLLFPEGVINLDEELPVAEEPSGTTEPSEREYSEEKLEAMAKCLSGKGIKFYGTHWCGFCVRQKEIFGEAAKYLPYIECAPDRATKEELAKCEGANVGSIPDWRFPDKRQELGFQSLEKLAELSGCPL